MKIAVAEALDFEADFVALDCLDDETVVALAEGALEGDARSSALSHLESCATCSALVGQAARLGSGDRPSLGRYQIIEQIGAGGMGRVFLAYDPALEREVALKLLDVDALEPDVGSARLLREAQTLAALDHPALCKVFDVQQQDDIVFIAMELVRGRTFAAWLATRPEPAAILAAFVRAGEGLAAAHDAGVVHRDFKPTNAMIDESLTRVIVLDFGLARREQVLESSPAVHMYTTAVDVGRRTRSAIAGTPIYMAPEQYEGTATPASDQYSFCLVLVEALVGRFPFADEFVASALRRAKLTCALVDGIAESLPAPLRKALLRGLDPDPDARWPSMRALLEQLRAGPRKHWPWIASAAAVLALGAVYVLTRAPAVDCARAEEGVTAVWNDARRAALHDAFAQSGAAAATDLATRIEGDLDEHARAIAIAYQTACEQRPTEADALFDARARCLDRRVRELDAAVGALRDLDAKTATASLAVVDELTDVARCNDEAFLLAMIPVPDDPRAAARVEAAEQELDVAEGERHLGRYRDALPLYEHVVAEARALEHDPLLADALAGLAGNLRMLEDPRIDEVAQEAHVRARLVRDHASAARAAIELVLATHRRGDLAGASRWLEEAELDADEANVPKLRAQVLAAKGAIAFASNEFEDALALRREAVQIHHDIDPRGQAYAVGLRDVANTLVRLQRTDDAIEALLEARTILVETLGTESARVAEVESELGFTYLLNGDVAAAIPYLERGIPLVEQQDGVYSRSAFSSRSRLAAAYREAGRVQESIDESRRALALLDHSDHSPRDAGVAWMNLAKGFEKQRDFAAALEAYEKGRGILEAAEQDAPLSALLAMILMDTATVLDELERTDEADALRTRAKALAPPG